MNVLKRLLQADEADLACVQTMFGRTKVYDVDIEGGHVLRVLDVNGTWQSATFVDEAASKLAFGYHEVFDQAFKAPLAINSMLMLGGGALSYPKHLLVCHDSLQVDVVEIDPAVLKLAEEWFLLDQLSDSQRSRMQVACTDAISFVDDALRTGRHYDFIANDLFAAKEPLASLMDADGLGRVKSLLAPEGIYAANVVASLKGRKARPLHMVQDALSSLFSQVETVSLGEDEPRVPDNNVVFASNGSFSLAEALGTERA